MRLETERLILRPFEDRDRDRFAAIHADPRTMRFYPAVWSRERSDAVIGGYMTNHAAGRIELLAAERRDTGVLVGTIGLTEFSPAARAVLSAAPEIEIGWRLDHAHWGLGLAPEGARACLRHAWEVLGLAEVHSMTAVVNRPSQRVMEKIGMTRLADQDFDHPNVPEGSPLRRHVLYRIARP